MANYRFRKQLYFILKEVIIAFGLLIASWIVTGNFNFAIVIVLIEVIIRLSINYFYKRFIQKNSKEDPFDNSYAI